MPRQFVTRAVASPERQGDDAGQSSGPVGRGKSRQSPSVSLKFPQVSVLQVNILESFGQSLLP